MKTIHAVYEQGVFRPTVPVELPEACEVEFEPRVLGQPADPGHHRRFILGELTSLIVSRTF